jgi:hypothetical protein
MLFLRTPAGWYYCKMKEYKIKILSLKHRIDRQDKIKKVFEGFDFEFFWGMYGKDYTLTEYDKKWITGNNYREWGVNIKSLVASSHSHLNILRECISEGIPYFVFEDDVKLNKPIDFSFTEIAKKDLDVFWLVPDKPSILGYVVWPSGASKLIDAVDGPEGLLYGLDYMWHFLKNTGYLNEEQLWDDYFWQIAGDKDSDMADKLYFNFKKKRLY